MGQNVYDESVGTSTPARVESRGWRASSGGLDDDVCSPISPPAVGLMRPVLPTDRLTSNGLLIEEGEDENLARSRGLRSAGEHHSSTDKTYDDVLRSTSHAIDHGKTSMMKGNDTRRLADEADSSETTALLASISADPYQRTPSVSRVKDWDDNEGKVGTTWRTEFIVLTKYSLPLILTCLLQYSLSGASVVAVGHLGKTELGAVSLAIMTSNVTGYCVYAGLATSLDTLCAQAYGSGKPHLVGLHVQRMVYFLWIVTVPIAAIWVSATRILLWITPERECAELAGLFLKILIAGAPGFALFEAGKRFVQAQGLFNANLYVLLTCAPLNAFMNWLFVWVRPIYRPNHENR